MSQTRTASAIEATANVAIGFGIALLAQALIFPRFGFTPSASENLQIGALFTLVSLARSYLLRRLFNAMRRQPDLIWMLIGLPLVGGFYGVLAWGMLP